MWLHHQYPINRIPNISFVEIYHAAIDAMRGMSFNIALVSFTFTTDANIIVAIEIFVNVANRSSLSCANAIGAANISARIVA